MERLRFWWRCNCGQRHYRWCTPKNLEGPPDLLCLYCQHNSAAWREARKFPLPECEVVAARAVKALGIDSEVTWQVMLPFWSGCLDLVHLPTLTVFSIDGDTHFRGCRGDCAHGRLLDDLRCCKQAWQHGMRLVRIHHKCANMQSVIKAAIQMPEGGFLLLTIDYEMVEVYQGGLQQSYIDRLAGLIPGAEKQVLQNLTCVLFK